ncbi:MAG: EF-hand domain-containing protein [Crocinitomicaceae bacterium]
MKKLQVGLMAIGMMAAIQVNAQEGKKEKPKQTPEQRFAKMDANDDGVLTLDEIKKGKGEEAKEAEARFKKWDTNADGKVTKEEFLAKKEKQEAKKEVNHEKLEGKVENPNKLDAKVENPDKLQGREATSKLTPEQHFAKIDANGDATITLDEMKKGKDAKEADEHFKKMDTNGDGRVSKEEFLAKKEMHDGKPKKVATPPARN